MSDKTYVFDSANGNKSDFDPNLLLGMMFGGGGMGGLGGGNYIWPLFLLALLFGGWGGFGGFGGNGMFGGGGRCAAGFGFLSDQINNTAGRDLLMQAIQGNRDALNQLATNLNCTAGDIRNALNSLGTQICNVSNQVGMSSQQIINALERGDCNLANQIAQCCCDIKQGISESNYLTERAINGTNQILTKGFSDIGYAQRDQTCVLEKALETNTARILDGQRAAEMRELNREIAERDRKIAEQGVIINNAQQTAAFGQMLNQATTPIYQAVGALQSDVDKIKCKLPETYPVQYQPFTAVPNCLAAQYGLGGGFGLGQGGFWY